MVTNTNTPNIRPRSLLASLASAVLVASAAVVLVATVIYVLARVATTLLVGFFSIGSGKAAANAANSSSGIANYISMHGEKMLLAILVTSLLSVITTVLLRIYSRSFSSKHPIYQGALGAGSVYAAAMLIALPLLTIYQRFST